MFITDAWNDLFRFVAWMAAMGGPSSGGKPPSGGGGGGGSSGSGSEDGSERDFEEIYREYHESVLWYFRRMGASHEDAKDLTNETFLRVYRNIGRFRGEASLKTWIFSIATNVWRNDLRWWHTERREGEEVELDDQQRGSDTDVLEAILEDEKKKKLYKAMKTLPLRMRTCVWYRIHHELKYREIAERMGTSIGTVKAQLFEAEKRLRSELKEYFDPSDWRDDGE